jgi:hypothetical protein
LQLSLITKQDDPKVRDAIKKIDDWQLSLIVPKNFDNESPDYYIKKIEKGFENLCATLEDLGVHDPKRLTVFEFYSRLEYFKNKKPKGKKQTTSKP